jgi:type II secretion system protein D
MDKSLLNTPNVSVCQRECRFIGAFFRLTILACGLLLITSPSTEAAGKPRLSLWKSNSPSKAAPPETPSSGEQPTSGAPPTAQRPATGKTPSQSNTVTLNYFGATWDVVFRDLAQATGSQLIANRIPSGRFTRRDKKTYTRSEAVRIINKEIESKGFRILEQDELLVVLDIPSIRPRYQPAEIKPTLDRLQPVAHAAPKSDDKDDRSEPPPKSSPRSRAQSSIRPANHEVRSADHAVVREEEGESATDVASNDRRKTVVVFRSRYRPVLDISGEIYRAYPQRAELIATTADSLPAFRVRHTGGSPEDNVQFDVTVDQENDEVRIEIPKEKSKSVMRLFRSLDVPAKEQSSLTLVAESPAVCRIAAQLVPELDTLRKERQAARRVPPRLAADVDDDDAWLADDEPLRQPEPERPVPPPRDKTKGQQAIEVLPPNLTDIIGNLKGEVTIESFEDLGALILKGAAEDVEQVMQVIRQLEKLSEATAPRVHLLNLHHVDSRALAELLSQVYERLTKFPGRATQPRQNVAILPVSKPNAVLIIAPAGDLPSILELADELDQPVDPQTEFQVFPLKTAVAAQVEQLLTEFYEDRVGLDTRILIRADPRSNTVIIRARPRDLDEAAALIKKIDRDGTASVSQVQIFHLTHAAAAELAAILNMAIQSVLSPPSTSVANPLGGPGIGGSGGGGQVDEQFRTVKSTVLQFLAVDAGGERKLRSGLLSDIRITPDARMNALIVSAPERSMQLMAELIRQLDRPAAAVAEIKVFPLTNADAQRVVQQLQTLFSPTGQQGGQGTQQRQALGIQVVGAEDAGSGLIPLRFSVDTRTNSIIAIGGAEALGVVEAILYRLDEGDIRERQQVVYRLKNSPAANIANAITDFLTSQRERAQDPTLVSTVEQLEREVIVVAEPVSNSLLISATPRYFDEIQRLVKKLDEPPAQVTIQALLVEVTLDNTDEFGLELGFQNSLMFDRSVKDPPTTISTTTTQPNGNQTTTQTIISQTATPGFNFNNPAIPLGNNINASPSAMALQSLSNFSMSRVNSDLGFGGLVLSAGSDTVNVLLRALSSSRRVQILSRPQIRTLDNQTATILQGQVVPVVNGVTISGNGLANPIVQQQEAGIILTVTPRVSPDGQIVMDLIAEKSSYRAQGVPIFTDASNGNVIESPIKDISTARAVVSVPSNQTVVIGGLITSSDDRLTRKVPWLGDIPILGYAFRYDARTTARKELLIFLTPRLVREDVDSELIKDVEIARMHFIEAEAEEIHGPLRGVPAEMPIIDGEVPWFHPDQSLQPSVPALPTVPQPALPKMTTPSPEEVPPPIEDGATIEVPDAPPPVDPTTKAGRRKSSIKMASFFKRNDSGTDAQRHKNKAK